MCHGNNDKLRILFLFFYGIHHTYRHLDIATNLSLVIYHIFRRCIPRLATLDFRAKNLFLKTFARSKAHSNPNYHYSGKHRLPLAHFQCKYCKSVGFFRMRTYFFLLGFYIFHIYNYLELQPSHIVHNTPNCQQHISKLRFLYLFPDYKIHKSIFYFIVNRWS